MWYVIVNIEGPVFLKNQCPVINVLHPNSGMNSIKIITIRTTNMSYLNGGHQLYVLFCTLCFGAQIMHPCAVFWSEDVLCGLNKS